MLEAKAATAKANYQLQSNLGAEQVETGHLAQAITASPLPALKVQALDQLTIPDKLDQLVRDAIDTAFKDRPDLQAEEARVRAAHAQMACYSSYYPSISFEGSKGWLRAFGEQRGYPGLYGKTDTHDAMIGLRWTVFDGLLRENRVKTAKAEEKVATEEVRNRQDEIADQVWTEYANAQTALRESEAATALLTASKDPIQQHWNPTKTVSAISWMYLRLKMLWRRPGRSTSLPVQTYSRVSVTSHFEPGTCSQIIRKVRIHEFYRFESVASQEHTSDLGGPCDLPRLCGEHRCSRSPALNLLGSYFPAWLVCIGIATALTLLAHMYATKTKLAEQLWPSPIVYSALLCLLSVAG